MTQELKTCDFCGAIDRTTQITARGEATLTDDAVQEGKLVNYELNFIPSSLTFELVKINSLAHAFKQQPVNTCTRCEKIVWVVVGELNGKGKDNS
jgi:hypothetical protein